MKERSKVQYMEIVVFLPGVLYKMGWMGEEGRFAILRQVRYYLDIFLFLFGCCM